jgi:TonB family protein
MNRGYFSMLLPLLLLVCGFKVMPPQQTQTPEKAAQEAAETWLRLIDSGKYGESWDELAGVTKAKVSKDSWEKHGSSTRGPSDAAKSNPRKLRKAISVPSLIGIRNQAGVVLEYVIGQDPHSSDGEMVELVLEADRGWRVAFYMKSSCVLLYDPSSGRKSQDGMPDVEQLHLVDMPIGDPKGVPGPGTGGIGSGSGGGIGSGNGTGAGPGNGYNLGSGDRNTVAAAVDQRPVPLNAPQPHYTDEARKDKIHGTVVARVLVGADGSVKQVRIVRGLPDGLDEEAIRVAYQLRFKPAMKGGQPVPFWQGVSIEFNLPR